MTKYLLNEQEIPRTKRKIKDLPTPERSYFEEEFRKRYFIITKKVRVEFEEQDGKFYDYDNPPERRGKSELILYVLTDSDGSNWKTCAVEENRGQFEIRENDQFEKGTLVNSLEDAENHLVKLIEDYYFDTRKKQRLPDLNNKGANLMGGNGLGRAR